MLKQTNICLTGNVINGERAEMLCEMLKVNTTLTSLILKRKIQKKRECVGKNDE